MSNFGLLVVGSRSFSNYSQMCWLLDSVLRNMKGIDITIISGGAKGADSLAERYAKEHGYSFLEFPAKWGEFGKSAGYIRNSQMHEYLAETFPNRGVVAAWDGQSCGTAHSFELCATYQNPLIVYDYIKNIFLDGRLPNSVGRTELFLHEPNSIPIELPF